MVQIVSVVVRQEQCSVVKRVPAERKPCDTFKKHATVGIVSESRLGKLDVLYLPSAPVDDGYSGQVPCRRVGHQVTFSMVEAGIIKCW